MPQMHLLVRLLLSATDADSTRLTTADALCLRSLAPTKLCKGAILSPS